MTISDINVDRLIEMYIAGHTALEVAQKFGVSKAFVYKRLKLHGVAARPRKNVSIRDAAVTAYLSGVSELGVSEMLGVSRSCVRKALQKSGVHVRSQSESESLKWSKMTADQRARQVEKAHEASRNESRESIDLRLKKSANSKELSLAKVGFLELEFFEALKARGVVTVPQLAYGRYNIDLAIGHTAIEIHATTANPHTTAFYQKRVVNLLKGGWNAIYIKCIGKISLDRAADKVCELVNISERDKTVAGQYWMVRGSGDLVSHLCLDGDELSAVGASNAVLD